jgi:2-amino-4-hydroxy-6-hydroxymethyldihydropteridine diphosphokinase
MYMHKVYLGLGSNLGDRSAYLEKTIGEMDPEVRVLRRSAIYETAPWGFEDQQDFLNMVIEAESELGPPALLKKIKDVEKRVGRQATFRNGPREIDIDILLYDDSQYAQGNLTIPHPRLPERAFILAPLAEIAPDLIIPGQEKSVAKLIENLDVSGVHEYIPKPVN